MMDATPNTMLYPGRVREVYDQQGSAEELRIIFSLREPVAREVSWYQHLVREATGKNPPKWSTKGVLDELGRVRSFANYTTWKLTSLNKNPKTCRGFYAYWLNQWFKCFDRQQILIVSYEDFKANQTDVLLRIHEFLGLPVTGSLSAPRANAMHVLTPPIECEAQQKWAKQFEVPNEELYSLLEANPGPFMEKRPFQPFEFKCKSR